MKENKEGKVQKSITPQSGNSEIFLYQTEDGRTRIEVQLKGETVWLSQKQLAELFQKDVSTINEHIGNLFDEHELNPESVIRNFRITAADGKSYDTKHYNLDVIISVGYRVKSHRGTQFRIWATERLREYIIKGFALDDQRLKNAGGGNYFRELLARMKYYPLQRIVKMDENARTKYYEDTNFAELMRKRKGKVIGLSSRKTNKNRPARKRLAVPSVVK